MGDKFAAQPPHKWVEPVDDTGASCGKISPEVVAGNVTELVHEHHSKGISLPSMTILREIDHGTEKPSHEGCRSLWMNMDSNSTAEA